MADEPDQSPVEQKPELQLLMPHEYRLRDAAIDSIKNHRILSALLLIGTVLLTLMFMTVPSHRKRLATENALIAAACYSLQLTTGRRRIRWALNRTHEFCSG